MIGGYFLASYPHHGASKQREKKNPNPLCFFSLEAMLQAVGKAAAEIQ